MKILLILLFPLMILAQDTPLIGDVDCSGEVNSLDASLILQFVTNVIDELPCQDNMTGLTPEQLEEIINMMDEQLSISYGGGSNYPVMVSSISSETMNWGDALIYCDGLEEGGYSDWFLPNLDQLAYAVSGGCDLPDERTENSLWTTSKDHYYPSEIIYLYESGSMGIYSNNGGGSEYCRCVRFGESETSEGSIGSPNSTASFIGGGSGQPITMIGPMYLYDEYPDFITNTTGGDNYLNFIDATRFCKQLIYNGYDDWHLPSMVQLINYNVLNNSIIMPNYSNQADDYYWSSSQSFDSYTYYYFYISDGAFAQVYSSSLSGIGSTRRCFCVR